VQGALELLHELERLISAITGFEAITLQPAAGAQGEFAGMMIIRAHLLRRGERRSKVLVPDSAHGTNPATASMCGYDVVHVPTDEGGELDIKALEAALDDDVVGIMMTVPNTLGIFESRIERICELTHSAGGFVYCDGANMNAMVGCLRPAELGIDVMHLNLHKTFSTPHGGGGPGAGALCVTDELEPYLPVPRVIRNQNGSFERSDGFSDSIGRLHGNAGNFGNLVRAYTYIRSLGDSGLREVGESAVLNANYLQAGLSNLYELAYDRPCMHEVVFAGLKRASDGIRTLDVAKRLIDLGFHPPTIYFPLIVDEALMIEPTETESIETLDRFIDAMRQIADEAQNQPHLLLEAPNGTPVRRLDETSAARHPNLRWDPERQN
jgi:glycine dehydrogenase subunit 2